MSNVDADSSSSRFPHRSYQQSFSVSFDYPVYFTRRVFERDNPLIASVIDRRGESRRHRVMFYVDAGVARTHPRVVDHIADYFQTRSDSLELCAEPTILEGGEAVKNSLDSARDILRDVGEHHLDRQSFVAALGGGSLLDVVGLAASLAHRGVRLLRFPTTVLAQCDAGVGVKNGMNAHGMKNFIGAFAPPFAVINDFSFLPTLAERDWRGGVAEAFKVAIIKDADFLEYLRNNASLLRQRDQSIMENVVHRAGILHLEHIRANGDPFEFGAARPLDFGHWAAHKLESLSNYSLGHGEAVAVGMAIDLLYSARLGLITQSDCDRILDAMQQTGLEIWHPLLEESSPEGTLLVLQGLEDFREHLGGTLNVTLPDPIGSKREVHQMQTDLIREALQDLKNRRLAET